MDRTAGLHVESSATRDEDRRPLDVEVESLAKAISALDDSLSIFADRLHPVLSDRAVAVMGDVLARDSEDARSPLVRDLDRLGEHIVRLTERVQSLQSRVDC